MQDSRNNIMFRKQRAYNGRNNTSAESEYDQEQARINGLRQKREQIEEHRRVVLHGSTEERSQLKSRVGQDAQLQLYIKEQKVQEEREKHQRECEAMENHRRALVEMERQREMEKREKLRQAQESNRISAISKRSQHLENKVYEDSRDKDVIRENIYKYQPNVL
jgi:hypothetical protein